MTPPTASSASSQGTGSTATAAAPRHATHPLARLTAAEIATNREILRAAGVASDATAFALVDLVEPHKADVLAGRSIPRTVQTLLLHRETGETTEAVVDLDAGAVVAARTVDVEREGQPPILLEEFDRVEELLWAHDGWQAAMRRRGIEDMRLVRISALSAGRFDIPGEEGRRIVRCLAFLQLDERDNAWAHPVDGVVAYLDLITGEVTRLIDDRLFDIPRERYNFHLDDELPPPSATQKPIVITQPEGPSFTVDGDEVAWERWRFRIGFTPVEGLVLHQIGVVDGERLRPVVYRASIAEMVVPYGDPSPVRFWQNYFDAGEYSLGKEANPLALGCDCLGDITYFDAVLSDSFGNPRTIPNAICMHEEDASILFKHTDAYYGSTDVRRNRRLVVSFFITVGNYDYGFYWYLYLDGKIEFECKATGVVFASAYPGPLEDGTEYPWASEVAPGIGAPYHQHLFSARLDMSVDGTANAVDELESVRVPMGPANPYGNGFTQRATRIARESESAREADNKLGRAWQVLNPDVTNRVGKPVSYILRPEGLPGLLADPASSIARRAAFTTKDLWVTRYDPAERFPSGALVNQNDGWNAIDSWVKQDRDLDGQDIVLWHTFGLTHYPRPEDWPVMPVDSAGFALVPHGFFDRNPALDAPRPVAETTSCHAPAAAGAKPESSDAPSSCCSTTKACSCSHTAHR